MLKNPARKNVQLGQQERRLAPPHEPRRTSIGNYPIRGGLLSATRGTSGPANVGQELDTTPKPRTNIQPTWRAEFEDDSIHPAAAPSRTPVLAGGLPGSGQKANAFRLLGDAFGGRG